VKEELTGLGVTHDHVRYIASGKLDGLLVESHVEVIDNIKALEWIGLEPHLVEVSPGTFQEMYVSDECNRLMHVLVDLHSNWEAEYHELGVHWKSWPFSMPMLVSPIQSERDQCVRQLRNEYNVLVDRFNSNKTPDWVEKLLSYSQFQCYLEVPLSLDERDWEIDEEVPLRSYRYIKVLRDSKVTRVKRTDDDERTRMTTTEDGRRTTTTDDEGATM
jgi:hypothetical protein